MHMSMRVYIYIYIYMFKVSHSAGEAFQEMEQIEGSP